MPHRRIPTIAALAALAAAGPSHAQPATPPSTSTPAPVALAPYLEQRVVEELAADGVILSRLGVVLDLASVGDVVLVTLVDPHTGRPMASTKLDHVPSDRDSAVATLTPVAASLVSQLVGKKPDGDAATREHLATLEAQQRELLAREEAARLERERLAAAEREYDAQAIRFGAELVVSRAGDASVSGFRWHAARGEAAVPLTAAEFYRLVDRRDLAAQYQRRRQLRWGAMAVAGACVVGAVVSGLTIPSPGEGGHADHDAFVTHLEISAGLVVGGVIAGFVGAYYAARPHPVSERTARQLGADYNRALRVRLGLPVPAAAPTTAAARELKFTPYAARDGGGFAVTGTF